MLGPKLIRANAFTAATPSEVGFLPASRTGAYATSFGGLLTPRALGVRDTPVPFQIEGPSPRSGLPNSFAFERCAVIGLDGKLPAPLDVVEVTADGSQVLAAVGEDFHHDFGRTTNGPGDDR